MSVKATHMRAQISAGYLPGALAQSVEQRTENPCVPGSIPGGTTEVEKPLSIYFGRGFSLQWCPEVKAL